MPYADHEEHLQAQRNHYKKNKKLYIKQQRDRREVKRQWAREYKVARGCTKCGENHPAVLDFHHLKGSNKEMCMSEAVYQLSKERVEKEAAKCEILCSNCHRKQHWEEKHRA